MREQPQYEEGTISLMDIILPLARYLKPIIITPTILCIVTIIYVLFFAEPMYVSTSKFMSSRTDENQFKMMGLASQLGLALPTSDSGPQWSYEEVIKGRTMAHKLLKYRFDTEKYGPQKELFEILTYGNKFPKFKHHIYEFKAVEAFQKLIKINKNTTTGVYKLDFSSIEPKLSSEIVSIILEEMEQFLREYNAQQTTKTREFIEERLIDTKFELEASEEDLKVFRQRNRTVLESPQLQLEQERLARDVAVLIGVFTTLKQQLETAKIEEVKESDYLVILDTPEISIYPATPKKKLMVFLAGFLGILLGVAFAFFKAYIKNSDFDEKEKMKKAKSYIYRNILELFHLND